MPNPSTPQPVERFSRLADWLSWQETLHPKAIDLGLERVRQVATQLDEMLGGRLFRRHQESGRPVKKILVAGTNGKGSCVASMSALLRHQGLSVGCYTSPHLIRYNERISINGIEASDTSLCAAFHAIDHARGETSLSYFEFGTLAAFWLMAQADLDIWLIEVGLGGRLDATNILDADIAIITSIDIDHEAFLGDTRELIAVEKLGIARSESFLICAEENPPLSLIEGVKKLGCSVMWAGRDFSWRDQEGRATIILGDNPPLNIPSPQLPLPSVAAAMVACNLLGQLPEPIAVAEILSKARLAGRWHRFNCQGVDVLLDVAHNPASTQVLADYLDRDARPFVMIMGMMADKNIQASLKPLHKAQQVYTTDLPLERAATAARLADQARLLGLNATEFTTLKAALLPALEQCRDLGALLVICGSFFTLAAAYPALAELGAVEVCNG